MQGRGVIGCNNFDGVAEWFNENVKKEVACSEVNFQTTY